MPRLSSARALILYGFIAAIYTQPLLWRLGSGLASDLGDPALNASILLWNATHVPFSPAWWNAPHYFPATGVAGFTENLVGLWPIATPIIWITGSPIVAYNVVLLLTWPLTAWTTFLLVAGLTGRRDAAFVAGLACAFTPYRLIELAHVQMLVTWWLPLMLFAMHRALRERRSIWLALFAASWLLNSLSNGHFMLFGAVLLGLWLAYFGSKASERGMALRILAVWAIASLPLVPVMWKYQQIHTQYGLTRVENEIIEYSAQPSSWFHVHPDAWLWSHVVPDGKDDLFPGVTAFLISVAGAAAIVVRARRKAPRWPASRRRIGAALSVVLALTLIVLAWTLRAGPWNIVIGETTVFKVTDLSRVAVLLTVSGGALLAMNATVRAAFARRSPLLFYAAAVAATAVLCFGPVLRVGTDVLLDPLPYRFLMALPGFHELRATPRFWMLGTMCLAVAAGLAMPHLRPVRARGGAILAAIASLAILAEGWIPSLRMGGSPEIWAAEQTGSREPILELPIGPAWDFVATYRGAVHQRRVVNGVSGYNPPYYLGLVAGLQARDPRTLTALAAVGPIQVVVSHQDDPDGAIRKFLADHPGSSPLGGDDGHSVVHIPRGPGETVLGPALSVAAVRPHRHPELATAMLDGKLESGWDDLPQTPDQEVEVELDAVHEVGGITLALGDHFFDYPRQLVIDVSADRVGWTRVWDGPPNGAVFLAYVRAPRVGDMRLPFAATPARFIRLRQTGRTDYGWHIAELTVHGPP